MALYSASPLERKIYKKFPTFALFGVPITPTVLGVYPL